MKFFIISLLAMVSVTAFGQERVSLIQKAANNGFAGCYVKLDVQGYKQMYIDNKFRGNYVNRRDDQKLENIIARYILSGECREKYYNNSSVTVLRASAREFQGCHIKLNVTGYNQVYVTGRFSGNYINRIEDNLLEERIFALIDAGKCRESYYYGGYQLIDEVIAGELLGCSIKTNVDGYIQIYVGRRFSGNYIINQQEQELEERISLMIDKGICRYRS